MFQNSRATFTVSSLLAGGNSDLGVVCTRLIEQGLTGDWLVLKLSERTCTGHFECVVSG